MEIIQEAITRHILHGGGRLHLDDDQVAKFVSDYVQQAPRSYYWWAELVYGALRVEAVAPVYDSDGVLVSTAP